MDRYKGTTWRNFKLAMKRGFTYGLMLEMMFIGSGYMLYREYTTNRGTVENNELMVIQCNLLKTTWNSLSLEFREHVEDQYPQLTEYYNTVSGLYLKVMPKRLRDQILDVKEDDGQTSATQTTAANATNSAHSTSPSAITAAAAAVATTITQTQSASTPNK